jgi:hypothetical protein
MMKTNKIDKVYGDSLFRQKSTSSHGGAGSLHADWSRLVVLLIVMMGFVIGFFLNAHFNNPGYLLRNSVKLMLKQQFTASIEGKTSLSDSILASYRYRQIYVPGKGITSTLFLEGSNNNAPFDALSFLNLLNNPLKVKGEGRQDMYSHPTRHFYGVLNLPGNKKQSFSSYFEYWMDMQNQKAVRLSVSIVSRNVAVNAKGDSLSAETYLTFRFR